MCRAAARKRTGGFGWLWQRRQKQQLTKRRPARGTNHPQATHPRARKCAHTEQRIPDRAASQLCPGLAYRPLPCSTLVHSESMPGSCSPLLCKVQEAENSDWGFLSGPSLPNAGNANSPLTKKAAVTTARMSAAYGRNLIWRANLAGGGTGVLGGRRRPPPRISALSQLSSR